MKRIAALRRLSKDHHIALVLVLRSRRASDLTAAWRQLQRRFVDELEPHFALEESGILPALEAAGEARLAARTLEEHQAMRALVASGGPTDLAAFADRLEAHIRFEESELFETAQQVLTPAVLEDLHTLHEQGAGPRCPTERMEHPEDR
jgi:hemerythrin-like domain-containing protein